MLLPSLVVFIAGIPTSRVFGKLQSSPASFNDSRRAVFLQADCDLNGLVSQSSSAGCKNGVNELQRLFDLASEMRMVFGDIGSMQNQHPLIPQVLAKTVSQGRLRENQWIALSRTALKALVATTEKAGQPWITAVALIQLHLWKDASAKFTEADRKSKPQERQQMYPMMCDLARQFQDQGMYLEATTLWRNIRTFFDNPDTSSADDFARRLPQQQELASLQPVHSSFTEAPYVQSLRESSNASCPEISATEDDFLKAVRSSRPAVMRASSLVPDIKAWDAALQQHGNAVVLCHITPDGKFYGTTTRKDPKDPTRNQTWAVMPATQPLRLGKISAVANMKGARFYINGRDLSEIDPALSDWAGGPPAFARSLYPSVTQIWAALGGGAASLIHEDTFENVLAQVHGTKEVILWPPQDKTHLYGAEKPNLNLDFRCCPPKFKSKVSEDIKYNSNIGAADIRRPRKWAQRTSPIFCRISAGDALVIPAQWHHAVLSHPGEASECKLCNAVANLAVNFWFLKYSFGGRNYTMDSTHVEL